MPDVLWMGIWIILSAYQLYALFLADQINYDEIIFV
jgi:hypothetical protein